MRHRSPCVFILFLLVLFISPKSFSDVDKDSIFREARVPASMLDLQLAIIQRTWWTTYVLNPDNAVKTKYPFITGTGMGIELEYLNNDIIIARGIVTKLNRFLMLTEDQKKLLVKNTLRNLRGHLLTAGTIIDKDTGQETGVLIENRHIKLSVTIEGVTENTIGEPIRITLPYDAGFGQAGYANGYYIFSRPYFLDLELIDNKAVPGNKNSFDIEVEKNNN